MLLRSTATCCFTALQSAASQHSVAWYAQPLIAAHRAATLHLHAMLRFAQRASEQHSIEQSPHLGDFVVVTEWGDVSAGSESQDHEVV